MYINLRQSIAIIFLNLSECPETAHAFCISRFKIFKFENTFLLDKYVALVNTHSLLNKIFYAYLYEIIFYSFFSTVSGHFLIVRVPKNRMQPVY